MSMMDWDAYRKQLMAGIGDLKQLSPDTVAGYMTASGAGAMVLSGGGGSAI